MPRFIQLHVLTSYPACNLNRDDLGRPKTVRLPDGERLRVSSQSLKRAWRCSDAFQRALAGNLGTRTKEVGKYVYLALTKGVPFLDALRDQNAAGTLDKLAQGKAKEIARTIGGAFGVMQKDEQKEGKSKGNKEVIKYVEVALTRGMTFQDALRDQSAAETRAKLPSGKAKEIARAIGGVFEQKGGKGKKGKGKNEPKQESLLSLTADAADAPKDDGGDKKDWRLGLSPEELERVNDLVERCRESGKAPEAEALNLLRGGADASETPGEDDGGKKDFWKPFKSEQLAHLSPVELEGVNALVEQCRASGKAPKGEALNLLRKDAMAVDIALFGRMLTKGKSETDEKDDTKQDDKEGEKSSGIALQAYNVEAAAQVAHAMTVHKAVVEEDYFTAVDDLNRTDSGAGHVGVAEFGAGLFYLYLCIDRELLVENLGGNEELARRALDALIRVVCTVSPTGKQNSFASRAVASFCLAEKGDAQPRTLAEAFMPGLTGGESGDVLAEAIEKLEAKRAAFNRIMGEEPESLGYSPERGTLAEVAAFAAT